MDELWLRELLDRAIDSEPPAGPMAANSLRAGIKRRRRRRAQGSMACVAAAAMVAAFVAVTTTARTPAAAGNAAAGPPKVTRPSTLYALSGDTVTPIPSATNRPGKPIPIPAGGRELIMAVTPDGKTIYLGGDEPNTVVPVSTVTDTAGKPIQLGQVASQILITPNGKTAYVLTLPDLSGSVEIIPIATATNSPEKAIKVNVGMMAGGPHQMAITPDGKTLYIVAPNKQLLKAPSSVIPLSTATNMPGKPIKIQGVDVSQVVMNPDGRTLYAIGQSTNGAEVVPITTATNIAGMPVRVAGGAAALGITPDGQILYLVGSSGVIPFATATNAPEKPVKIGGDISVIAVTPDGETAYVLSQPTMKYQPPPCTGQTGEVTPIATATNLPGRSIRVRCEPYAVAITPDGATLWVASAENTLTPIATATNTPGKPITTVGTIQSIAVSPSP